VPVLVFSTIAGLLGLFLGCVVGLNGFAQPATSASALGQTPRVKNLLWLLSGFAFFAVDTSRLGLGPNFPWIWPFAAYEGGAVAGALAAVGWMLHSIAQGVREFQRQHPEARGVDLSELKREYLTYGKERCEEKWKKQKASALEAEELAERTKQHQDQDADLANLRRQQALDADSLAAECVHIALREAGASQQIPVNDLTDMILRAIYARISAASSRPVTLNGGYMTYISPFDVGPDIERKLLFTNGMPGNYTGYLRSRRGSLRAGREFYWPIAKFEKDILPGAPEAVVREGYSILDPRKIGFQEGVVPGVRQEIEAYYGNAYFAKVASIVSILVSDGNGCYGVVNIESSEPDLIGQGPEQVAQIVYRIRPLVALLSVFR
jgi:hypothetical protein